MSVKPAFLVTNSEYVIRINTKKVLQILWIVTVKCSFGIIKTKKSINIKVVL